MFFLALITPIPPQPQSFPFSPSTSVLESVLLCRRTECGEEMQEQSAAVWSSSCCLLDQRGNKRGLPGPTLLWRCLTDSQQLGLHSPPCRGQAAGLRGPEVTCPSLVRGRKGEGVRWEGNQQRRCLCLCPLLFFLPFLDTAVICGIFQRYFFFLNNFYTQEMVEWRS